LPPKFPATPSHALSRRLFFLLSDREKNEFDG
jgi:hypothetical protein